MKDQLKEKCFVCHSPILTLQRKSTNEHPTTEHSSTIDICQNLPPVEAHERGFYEPYERSRYWGIGWLVMLAACGAVWFYGTVMIIKFLVAG